MSCFGETLVKVLFFLCYTAFLDIVFITSTLVKNPASA